MPARRNRPGKVQRENRTFEVRGELRVRGRSYSVLEELGGQHSPRLLLDDPVTRQLRVALILPNESSTAQHVQVLRRLPRTDELPQILDFDRQRDRTIIVLTWVRGIELGNYLQRVKAGRVDAPSPYEAGSLVRGLAHALHRPDKQAQILHRDMKQQKLILSQHPSRYVSNYS